MSYLLFRPFAYLSIRHEGSSRLPMVNWGLPALVAAILLVAGAWVAPSTNVFHTGGIVDRLLQFIQTLPGFYLAALAAVATFGRENLDKLMPGTPPRVMVVYNRQLVEVELTRRRLLTMMFAYLTTLSIALTLLGVFGFALVDQLAEFVRHYAPQALPWVRTLAAFAFFTFTAQMIIITMWGLYYLGERMHTPD